MGLLGETLALATAVCWAVGTLLFSFAGRRVGAFAVNAIRIPIAGIILMGLTVLIQSELTSPGVSSGQYGWLVLSALFGLVIADGCHFKAMIILGPRVASLLAASTPIFAVLVSWIALDQRLGMIQLAGIAVTLAGLAWVILERNVKTFGEQEGGSKLFGCILAGVGALGQAGGLVAARIGMQEDMSPLSASMIRMVSAALMMWIIAVGTRRAPKIITALKDRKALKAMLAAAVIGPVFGVWMSLLAIKHTKIGIAATLMSTTPLWIIPLVMIIHHERPSARTILGTVITMIGVAVLMLT